MSIMYRKRAKTDEKSFKTAISLRPDTVDGINRMRRAFHRRWPEASYPSLSMVLDAVIAKNLERLQDPEELAVEVEFYERKFVKREATDKGTV